MTSTPDLIEPPVTELSAPFWDATRERRFVLPWSTARDGPLGFPRQVAPAHPDAAEGDRNVVAVRRRLRRYAPWLKSRVAAAATDASTALMPSRATPRKSPSAMGPASHDESRTARVTSPATTLADSVAISLALSATGASGS